jgi:chemotaxis protein CheX
MEKYNVEKYIVPFIEVCQNVFKNLGSLTISAGRPYIANKELVKDWELSAIIGLSGEARGAVVISMKEELALRLAGHFSKTEFSGLNEDVKDVIGEVVNIIAGNAKKRLESEFALSISLPTIVCGELHSMSWAGTRSRIICIPFAIFETEQFLLSVTFESGDGA